MDGGRLRPRDKVLCGLYGVIAAGALVATWSQNLRFFARSGNGGLGGFLRDAWANPAAASLSNDVLFVALAASVFMIFEAHRLGIKHAWVYVVLALVVAISVAFPVFLIVRQLAVARGAAEGVEGRWLAWGTGDPPPGLSGLDSGTSSEAGGEPGGDADLAGGGAG